MSGTMHPNFERFEDLQIQQALYGLSDEQQAEYLELKRELNLFEEDDSIELVAAAFDLAICHEATEELPGDLRLRIVAEAEAALSDLLGAEQQRQAAESATPGDGIHHQVELPKGPRGLRTREWFGLVLIAACLGLVLFSWKPGSNPRPQLVDLSPQARYRDFVERVGGDVVRVDWTVADPSAAAGMTGEVVWSDAQQEGFMLFKGLPKNDPAIEQYQLWIFDRDRDERYPVDGGVFNIEDEGAAIVPIRAKLPVRQATLFAITIERPGGVVVSDRKRLPLIAAVN